MLNGETQDNKKPFLDLMAQVALLNDSYVIVGIFDSAVAAYAAVNEFGTDHAGPNRDTVIPERSFFRSTLDKNRAKYDKILLNGLSQVMAGKMTAKRVMFELAQTMEADIKQAITDYNAEHPDTPNADSTLERKTGDSQLIDTGLMRNLIASVGMHKHNTLFTHGKVS